FAPVQNLGLVVVWDDGDSGHSDEHAPFPHVRVQAAGITDCPAAAFRPLRADTRSSLDLSCEVGCAALLRRLDVRTPYLGMEGLDLTHGNDGSYVAHGFDAENPDAPMYTGVEYSAAIDAQQSVYATQHALARGDHGTFAGRRHRRASLKLRCPRRRRTR
ncbi:hypothetical protein ACWEQU_25035, partial [Streptomyces nodosus]